MNKGLPLLACIACLSVAWACGTPALPKPKASAVLRIECVVSDAEIWINNKYTREVSEQPRGMRLRPGKYRIELRHAKYHSTYRSVVLESEGRQTLELDLAQRF